MIDRAGDPVLSRRFDELLDGLGVEVVPVSAQQAYTARTAYRDFGEGSGHPAGLNFGDCFSYALAITSGEPLLFKLRAPYNRIAGGGFFEHYTELPISLAWEAFGAG